MKVSVVIPAYNEEKYIEKCLESVVNQAEKPDEIIVVDNNCADKTVEIAQKYGVRIVKEKKQGMIYARNAGFDNAKYEIIGRIDADTVLPDDWISKVKEAFKDSALGGLSGPTFYFKTPIIGEVSRIVAFGVLCVFRAAFGHATMFGPNMAIRASCWEKIKNKICLSDKDVHEDIDLSIHLAPVAKIKLDRNFNTRVTRGRWRTLFTEYIVRLIKMFFAHRKTSS